MQDELKAKLTELGLTEDQIAKLEEQSGATTGTEVAMLSEKEIQEFSGCKPVTAKKVAAAFTPATATPQTISSMIPTNVLPQVPGDVSWLAALKVGGVLKFSTETVIGTVSAALAAKVGLYNLPNLLVEMMEKHAESLEEPVPADFFDMQRQLTERNYAEIFAAIPGATGRYATQGRKTELLTRLENNLWPSLIEFQNLLSSWFDSWQKAFANPAMMMTALASLAGGGGVMPQGMMQPPSTDPLRDAAENVIGCINRIFAGTGIPVAMALAYDAQQIRKALENPSLPAHVGAANREQMLRQLRVAVTSDYPRLELNLRQYALAVVELPNVTAGQTELTYITALFQLGSAIPWDKLINGSVRTPPAAVIRQRHPELDARIIGDSPRGER
ncbi:MAG: hypothetical protein V1897_02460 [Pseudomonadota bacterium]